MLVTFQPTSANAETTILTAQKGVQIGPFTPPVIGNTPGLTGYKTITAGNALFPVAGEGRNAISWQNADGFTIQQWNMDDEAAVDTGLETIATALVAETAAITLKSDGTLGS